MGKTKINIKLFLAVFASQFLIVGSLGISTKTAEAASTGLFSDIDSVAKMIDLQSFLGKPVRISVPSDNPDQVPGADYDYIYIYPPQFFWSKQKKLVSFPVKSVFMSSGKSISKEKEKVVKEDIENYINYCFCNEGTLLEDLKSKLKNQSRVPRQPSYLEGIFQIFSIVHAAEDNTNGNVSDTAYDGNTADSIDNADPNADYSETSETDVNSNNNSASLSNEDLQAMLNSDDPKVKQLLMLLLMNLALSDKLAQADNTAKADCLDQGGEWINNECVTEEAQTQQNNTSAQQTACANSGGTWGTVSSSRALCLSRCGKTDAKCSGSALADFEDAEGIVIKNTTELESCKCPEGQCAGADGSCVAAQDQSNDDDKDGVPNGQDACPNSTSDGSGTVNMQAGSGYTGCSCSQIQAMGGFQQQANCTGANGCDGPYMVSYTQQPGSCSNGSVTQAQCVVNRTPDQTCMMADQLNQNQNNNQQQQNNKGLEDLLKKALGDQNKQGGGDKSGGGGDKSGGGGGQPGGGCPPGGQQPPQQPQKPDTQQKPPPDPAAAAKYSEEAAKQRAEVDKETSKLVSDQITADYNDKISKTTDPAERARLQNERDELLMQQRDSSAASSGKPESPTVKPEAGSDQARGDTGATKPVPEPTSPNETMNNALEGDLNPGSSAGPYDWGKTPSGTDTLQSPPDPSRVGQWGNKPGEGHTTPGGPNDPYTPAPEDTTPGGPGDPYTPAQSPPEAESNPSHISSGQLAKDISGEQIAGDIGPEARKEMEAQQSGQAGQDQEGVTQSETPSGIPAGTPFTNSDYTMPGSEVPVESGGVTGQDDPFLPGNGVDIFNNDAASQQANQGNQGWDTTMDPLTGSSDSYWSNPNVSGFSGQAGDNWGNYEAPAGSYPDVGSSGSLPWNSNPVPTDNGGVGNTTGMPSDPYGGSTGSTYSGGIPDTPYTSDSGGSDYSSTMTTPQDTSEEAGQGWLDFLNDLTDPAATDNGDFKGEAGQDNPFYQGDTSYGTGDSGGESSSGSGGE